MTTTAKQISMILVASAVIAVGINLVHPRRIAWIKDWSHQVEKQAAQHDVPLVPLATAFELFRNKSAVFIDARSPEDYSKGHVPDALSVPLESWDSSFMTLTRYMEAGMPLVVYCSNRECDDALLVSVELKAIGADVVLFIDGFDSWKEHGGEVAR